MIHILFQFKLLEAGLFLCICLEVKKCEKFAKKRESEARVIVALNKRK